MWHHNFSMQMLKTGITSMKVTCHHARKCHAEMMEYASHIRTTCMITPAIARQDSVERIAKLTLLVNQRIAMEESVYLRLPTLWTLSVSVPLEGLECSVKQVGMQLNHGLRQWTTSTTICQASPTASFKQEKSFTTLFAMLN